MVTVRATDVDLLAAMVKSGQSVTITKQRLLSEKKEILPSHSLI